MEKFNPNGSHKDLRPEFGFSDSDFIAGFIARCTKQKNPLVFLSALEKAHIANPSVKGLFVGEGDMDEEVDAYIQQHKMSDYLYRSPFRTDVPDLLHSLDVYCLPSLWEGLSIALLEAMAMQKAIIATPTDGTKEVIEHQTNGLVVPFDDTLALTNAIVVLYENRILKEKCEIQARRFVTERFNANRVAESVSTIYSEIMNNVG